MGTAFDDEQSPDEFRLRLFVSGATPRSMRASRHGAKAL